jgi:hypothetical protein
MSMKGLAASVRGNYPASQQKRYPKRRKHNLITLTTIIRSQKKSRYFLGMVNDITERKH